MTTAIITGGTRGIGRAIAKAILDAGGRVMITGLDQERLREAVTGLSANVGDPARVAGSVVDVRDGAAVVALMEDTARRFGGFNALVNNAGVGGFGDVATLADADWHRLIDTNLTGAFYCSRAALPWLRASGGGWVISIASLAAQNSFAGGAAYCASKAGLVAFSESLMQEVRSENIRVSVILPGSVDTDFSARDRSGDTSWKLRPEDVAEVVADLLRHPSRSLPSKVEIRPARTR